MGISIVIPVYKEKKNLKDLITRICKSVREKNFEIIVIDDNSKDGSIEILKKLKSKFKKLRYFVRKKKPRDLSRSCCMGFDLSKFENILVMDGDLQHRPEEINKLNNKIKKNYDFVIGDRGLLKKKNKGLKFYRLLSSIILIFIVNIFLGFKTNDPMSGFFAFKKKIYIHNKNKLSKKGYKILLDLIYSTSKKLKICDVLIDFNSRGEGFSKMSYKIIYFLIKMILIKFYKRIF